MVKDILKNKGSDILAYESIKKTTGLDRVESLFNHGLGFGTRLINAARPRINQRRELAYDILNDSRVDGTIIKTYIKSHI